MLANDTMLNNFPVLAEQQQVPDKPIDIVRQSERDKEDQRKWAHVQTAEGGCYSARVTWTSKPDRETKAGTKQIECTLNRTGKASTI